MSTKIIYKIDFEKELNYQQYKIVKEAEKPCLVLAGPGSGKTKVLVYRVCYLLENGVPPSSILLLTFTNKAAKEMIERVKRILGYYPKNLWAGTFHHIGNLILRIYGKNVGISPNFTILDEEDSIQLIKEVSNRFSEIDEFPPPAKLKEIISFSINKCEELKDVINTDFPEYSCFIPHIEKIYSEYQKKKRKLNAVDYDDLLYYWLKLTKSQDIGTKLSSRFKYILVDEYHDTNKIQGLIIYQMSKVHRNILAVGDDAQSIYSFRGATIDNILEFPKIYPDAKVFYLTINYRSTPEILNLANHIISHNRMQYPKELVSVRKTGVKPVIVKCQDSKDEALFVAQRIFKLLNSGIEPSEIGVLFRSRYQAADLEIELNKLKIPYIVRGGLRFFEQAHIKDIISYFRIIENPNDELSWKRVLLLHDGIGKVTAEKIWKIVSESKDFSELKEKVKGERITKKAKDVFLNLMKIIEKIKDFSEISEGISHIVDCEYGKILKKKYSDYQERLEDIESLKNISKNYKNLRDFLSEVSLQEHFKGENPYLNQPVVLSTIHQAKGLEWRIVFIIGVCHNHFPHPSSLYDIAALEEERRIFYVGVTRAKEDLYITYYLRDYQRPSFSRKSLFIEEIPPSLYEEWVFG